MYKYIKLFSVLLFVLSIQAIWGQKEGTSKNFTDMKKVNDAVAGPNGIWCGTDGGAFYYNFEDSSFSAYGKPEGLSGSSVTAVAKDQYGKIWFGSSNGILDVFDPSSNSFKRILDIYNAGRTMKGINSLYVKGDTVFVSTDFGLSLINPTSYFFYDTFFKFGDLSSNLTVKSSFKDDFIYVCLEQGIAKPKGLNLNLTSPESWQLITVNDGLPSNNVRKILKYRDTLIAATDKGIACFTENKWKTYIPSLASFNISDISVQNDTLYILAGNNVYVYKNNSWIVLTLSLFISPYKVISSSDNSLYAATNSGLLVLKGKRERDLLYPDCPAVNYFSDLNVDASGNLWVATGSGSSSKGFSMYDGEKWKNFNTSTTPVLKTDLYYNVFSADNKVYIGSHGGGFARVTNNSTVTVFNNTNTPLQGTKKDINYVVVPRLGMDSKQTLWVLNHDGADNSVLYALTKDSAWYSFKNYANLSADLSKEMIVDQYDTKWFTVINSNLLYYFNENNTLKSNSDDIYGQFSSSEGLNGNIINCISLDKRGDIWVGTSLGVNIITNAGVVLNNKLPKVLSVYALRQQAINCIAVDPLNQKWVGTNQGLWVLSSDGTSLIKVYDSKNSYLLSDIIKSVTVDENTGTVYAATDFGISSFSTSFIKPADSFTELLVYPNPLIIDGSNTGITVDGLIKESEMKIISVSGQLVKQVTTPGGRVGFWDGKDSDGNYVGSGIYFIIAYDKEGTSVAKAKVAVIRKK